MTIMTVQNQNNRIIHTNMEGCLKLQSNCNSRTEILHSMKSTKIINITIYTNIPYASNPSCLQTTFESELPQESSHTEPQAL